MIRLRTFFAWIVILVLTSSPVFSQTFQDFKKQIRDEYDTFEQETQQKFDDFVSKIDKEFSGYLSENFGPYNIGHQKYNPSAPKPDNIPVVEEIEVSGDVIDYEIGETTQTYQGPVFPGIKKSEASGFDVQQVHVNMLGWPLNFNIDKAIFQIDLTKPSASGISSFWMEMGAVNYNHLLYQFSETANMLNLNQWGYYQLIKECSQQVYPGDANMQVLFQWAMLSRSRYKVKVGFDNESVFLLVPSVYTMYDIDFVNMDGIHYYVMDSKGNELMTYPLDFPEADILMDVSIKKPFFTAPIKSSKDLQFSYKEKKYSVNLKYDEQMIKFYQSIPLTDISAYFNSVVSNRTKTSVKETFKPILDGKTDVESANILLAFVQQAFEYKTDQEAFGTEMYFFPDELLFYPFADCEDRSILYAYLVKTLLNKEVAALGFPGHMATAINFGHDVDGSHFEYQNKTFVVADPTYFGAPIGMLMPAVIGVKPTIFPLVNNMKEVNIAELAWKKTNDYGGFKADRLNDVIFDKRGNIYVCGYFTGSADFDGQKLNGTGDERDVFVAKYDANLKPIWAKSATGTGNDLAFSMALRNDGGVYVYGSMENDLSFSGTEIQAHEAPDVFVANYSKDGNLEWATKAGIDKIDHSLDFMFAAKFNPQGKKIMAKLYSESEDFKHYGLEIDKQGNALIKGSFYATTGMNNNDFVNYNIGNSLNIPDVLHETDKKLKEEEYEATIAGLFSALRLLKANTIEIEGSQIKATFDKYNENFKSYASGIYENLADMKFLKNEKGIVAIKTTDEKPIRLDKIKIDNNARIRIVKYKSGNILVEVISGIYVGSGNYWLDMNSIKLFRDSGDLLFDFDADNSVKKLNLKKEILKR